MALTHSNPLIIITAMTTMLLFGITACIEKKPKEIMGYAPIYGSLTESKEIKSEASRAIVHAGKIYQYLQYTFQIENGEGIHVFDSSDPSNPQRLSFIKVPGCSEISVRNNILFTDNYQDLVAIDISNPLAVSVSARTEKVFPATSQLYPPIAGVYFECVDENLGIVKGWTEKLLIDPKCKR